MDRLFWGFSILGSQDYLFPLQFLRCRRGWMWRGRRWILSTYCK